MGSPPQQQPARQGPLRRWWLDRPVWAKGIIVVAVPLTALVAVTSASLGLQYRERQVRAAAIAASALNSATQEVVFDALNAETAVRGYAVTRDPLFLEPYDAVEARVAMDLAALRAAAVAEGHSGGGRALALDMTGVMGELAQLRSAASSGAPDAELTEALADGKQAMDTLRGQAAGLTRGSSAVTTTGRANITRMESTIDVVTIAGLALGILAGMAGAVLFASGVSRRVARAAANANRLGRGQPLVPVPMPSARDELGRLARSLVHAKQLLDSRAAELVAARDEAVRASQAKNTFLSSTSHELRTPMNAILGFTQLLQMSDLSGEDQDAVTRILAAGRHLLELINELIDIARIESGGFSLSVEPVAVQPVIEESCQLIAPLAAGRSIAVSQPLPQSGLAVSADRQRLRQVLVNLLSNAVKYNRAGGTVTVTCQVPGLGQADVAVTDTGLGIPAEDLERVFEPFERLGAEQTAVEGTGIGLPLARALAEAMHGHLTAASVPGEGTTFTLTLPRAQDIVQVPPDDEPVPLQPAAPGKPAGARLRILQIEDNPANIEVVSRFVKTKPGMRLQSVTSGQAGLEAAAREGPDLILLDMHMPGLQGDEVLSRLKGNPATAGIPVAVQSAEAAPAVIRAMRAGGAIAYLTKPLDLTELGRLLDTVAAGHGRPAEPAPRAEQP
jgi:signal transduction histidine kinase/ActR/RegA family two-component response regulator